MSNTSYLFDVRNLQCMDWGNFYLDDMALMASILRACHLHIGQRPPPTELTDRAQQQPHILHDLSLHLSHKSHQMTGICNDVSRHRATLNQRKKALHHA